MITSFFGPECSSGHVECSFDNPAKNILPKTQKFFAQNPKKLFFLHNFVFPEIIPRTCRMEFWQLAEIFSPKSENFSHTVWKNTPKKTFSPKCSSGFVECSIDNPAWESSLKFRKNSSSFECLWNGFFFQNDPKFKYIRRFWLGWRLKLTFLQNYVVR